MDKVLVATALVVIAGLILAPCFIWINNHFNNPEKK